MSAKLTYVSSGDEKKPEVLLDRHIGCMAGMFQLLGRRRLLAKRRLTNGDRHNTLPPPHHHHHHHGTSSSSSSSGRALSIKIKQREEHKPSSPRIISEHTPRKSSTEPSRAPILPSSPSSSSLDIRGVVKDSINGGTCGLSVKTSPRRDDVSKHQDSPRPTLSEQVLTRLREAARRSSSEVPRFSCDGREISRTKSSTKLREVPRLSLDSRAPSVIAKLMGLEPIPSSNTPNAVRSRAEGRARELEEFGESNNDRELGALKHQTLGTMLEKKNIVARKNSSSNDQTPHVATASPRAFEAPVAIMKPVKSFNRLEAASRGSMLPQAKEQVTHIIASKTRILPIQRSPRRQPADRERSASPVKALSPTRVQQRKIELEKKPRLPPPMPMPMRTESANRKQLVEPTSPRGNNRLRPNRAQKNGQSHNEDDADAKRGDHCSRRMESLLFQQGKQKKSLRIVKEEVSMAERAAVPPEQPSPVSVLDSSFYHDDSSPSPVKRTSSTLGGDDTPMSLRGTSPSKSSPEIDSWKKLRNIEGLVQKLRQLSSTGDNGNDESEEPVLNCVFEILTSSDLLTEHHSNPAKASPEKLHHRLMLDVVQEVLGQKMELISHGPQSDLFARARKLGRRFLLRELCKEIKWLLAERPRDAGFATMMSGENLLPRSEGWEDFGLEVPGVVVEIERLIFKDLIDNVVTGEVDFNLLGKAAQRRRQLFT